MRNRTTNEEEVIARELEYPVKELVKTELATMVEELLIKILGMSFHKAVRSIRSVVYNVFEQVMLDLLWKDIAGETIDAHITKIFNTDAANEGF